MYIEKLKKSDEGIYLCRVQNSAGVTTKRFDVRVIERPRLLATVPEVSNVDVNSLSMQKTSIPIKLGSYRSVYRHGMFGQSGSFNPD